MTPRLSRCFLLGSHTLRPHCGAFQGHLDLEYGSAEVVGRIGHTLHPVEALSLATHVLEVLRTVQGDDPLSLIRSCWETLLVMPRKELGPAAGADLSLLIVAEQDSRVALSAVGLDALWQVHPEGAQQLADPTTNETSHRGLPERTPKVLELPAVNQNFLARCLGDGQKLPPILDPYLPNGSPQ